MKLIWNKLFFLFWVFLECETTIIFSKWVFLEDLAGCSSSIGIFLTYKWFKIGVEKNTNLFLGYLFLFFGLAISLLIYAGANYYTDRVNLHGRYLIGFYLIIISASWISAPEMFLQILQIFKLGSDTAKTILIFLFSVLPIVLHTYLVVFILSRYF